MSLKYINRPLQIREAIPAYKETHIQPRGEGSSRVTGKQAVQFHISHYDSH